MLLSAKRSRSGDLGEEAAGRGADSVIGRAPDQHLQLGGHVLGHEDPGERHQCVAFIPVDARQQLRDRLQHR
ncbi:hypothetical protein [Corynebacterium halotolerans]|uniref:Uncharacterized protein n=1 Tax=Corynebacterium halotolerans YIM 70093 = DSM 44683 TaxID=1121362 RepID=M1P874_9CORY|nr:hypothetical protein [Corynebacterium halotolerans]AGF72871.1 hypothetical protein A605_09345 [Corynebacterium halotolerans YIM 70093 = DSM 44683]